MVTLGCEGERTQTVAEETWLHIRRGISPYTDCSRLKDLAYAPSSGEGNQDGNIEQHSERSRFEDVRVEMEPYLALFEPDRKAGGYVATFPDFSTLEIEKKEIAVPFGRQHKVVVNADLLRI